MTGVDRRREALREIEGFVCRDRMNVHGDCESNFQDIAELWSVYKGVKFTASDVAAMMSLMKIARIKSSPDHVDSWLDTAGYAVCGAGIIRSMTQPVNDVSI